ncbi:AsmA family protein [Pseudodonghicola xiamenensis]|uniref:Cell envelope biogenesis protein AsmA n=1 Tax=Pseudodonghicola xiamenensis TaxID=337702 RepID=A0A8J3ME94_9RHOB|nr:AsmA family protein [Pseudodonghicola xiamenensis]GHH01651.1 cell envelope biogenesis protein AsmA [Pseudodonghicola xiamenensis]
MKWMFRILGALVVAVIAAGIGVLMLPSERIARLAADQIEAQTGRKLTITGGLSLSYWPVLGVETGPVTLANAPWAGEEPMLRARSLSIGVSTRDLIAGRIRVTRVVAEEPMLNLTTDKAGRGNWVFSDAAASDTAQTGTSGGSATPVTLEHVQLTDARLRYAAAGADPVDLGPADLTLDWPQASGPADVTAALTYDKARIKVSARIAAMQDFIDGKRVPLVAKVGTAGATVDFDGEADVIGAASGQIEADSPDTAKLLAALGLGDVDLPKGLGRAAHLSAEAEISPDGRLALRDLAISADQNSLSGAADIDLSGAVPQINADLSAGVLDLSGLTGGGASGGAGGSGSATSGWSTAPIDASALGLANASVKFSAQSIRVGAMTLGPTNAELTLDTARGVLRLTPATIFGGSLSGRLVANNRKGFSVAGNLRASDLDTTQMLATFAGIDRLSGKLQADVEFLGKGASVDAIMKSLSGKGSLTMGRGVISGIDLDRLFRSGVASGGTTVFDSLTGSFTIKAGNLHNDDLLLSLSNFRVKGAGRVGLGGRDLDYLVTPVAFKSDTSDGLEVPVRVIGPWSAPKFRPDLDAAAKAKLDEQKDALEQKAKDKLKEKLNLQDGQSTEDAVRQKLEDEARKGILKLLGGN